MAIELDTQKVENTCIDVTAQDYSGRVTVRTSMTVPGLSVQDIIKLVNALKVGCDADDRPAAKT
jgi:hypothetical protein